MTHVAVFGAGIAGLTVAHELARRGHRVTVYEANADAGGFFRSARREEDEHMPSEYSWHGMGPWYHNVFDVLRQIPFDETGSVYDRCLSRPIRFGLASDDGHSAFHEAPRLNIQNMFRMTHLDMVRWAWLLLKTWTSRRRTREHYAHINAADAWKPLMSARAWASWKACFGPWIGSDWTNVSLHTAGQFFRKQLFSQPSHPHPADEEGPAWTHGARDGWLLLKGPSNDVWFEKWVSSLEQSGVRFFWNTSLREFSFDGSRITGATLASGTTVEADFYVLATNPFAARDILARTPALARQEQLRLFPSLIQHGPHTQVSLRIGFSERIRWPRKRTAVILADSPFNLTLFAQEQAWDDAVDLGEHIASLWTITACVATVPGRLHATPVLTCTKEQFLEDVLAQLRACEGLDRLLRTANNGRGFTDVPIKRIEAWHEWEFSPDGIRHHQPKWVNTTHNQSFLPTQETPIPNLILAGAHTKTAVDVWSIEAAVESGRRAATLIDPRVTVLPQYLPWWLRVLGRMDDACFLLGLPHVLDMALVAMMIGGVGVAAWVVK